MNTSDHTDERRQQFIGPTVRLRSWENWIDSFIKAVATRTVDSFGIQSFEFDMKAVNRVLATGEEFLDCLDPIEAKTSSNLIRKLQFLLSSLLQKGLSEAINPSKEYLQILDQLQEVVRFAVPYFQRLGVSVREEIAKRPADFEQGVTLYDVALVIEADDMVAKECVKRWIDSKKLTAQSIGKCPDDSRRKLYRLSEIMDDVARILSLSSIEKKRYLSSLRARLRAPNSM